MENILNEQELGEIRRVADNENMLKALEKVFLAAIYSQGTLKPGESAYGENFALGLLYDAATRQELNRDDKKLGECLRASINGIIFLQKGFDEIKKYKSLEKSQPKKNEAR